MDTQVLFIQGGGPGAHDNWDNRLVDSLRRELGPGFEVRYPRMPEEENPVYEMWSEAVRREIRTLNRGAILVGHSAGGAILIQTLAEQPPERQLTAIMLVSAPYIGAGGWSPDQFELPGDIGERLPDGVHVHVFHGLDDETVPPSHAELYIRAIPQAVLHLLPARDHQLGNDLHEVAAAIRHAESGTQ